MATPMGTETVDNPRYLACTLGEIRRVQRDISRKEGAAKKVSGKQRRFPVSRGTTSAYAVFTARWRLRRR